MSVNFCLPSGLGLGGVNLWSLQTGEMLARHGWTARLLVHRPFDNSEPMDTGAWSPDAVLRCPGRFPGLARSVDVWRYARVYRRALPGIFIPNWSIGTYATCACLARRQRPAIRTVAVVHALEEGHVKCAAHYEPIVYRFVAVSEQVARLLEREIPHRKADIVVRHCPVFVPAVLERTWAESGPIRIAYAGRLTDYEKRVSRLVPLAIALDRAGVDFRFDVFGSGSYAGTMAAELRAAPPSVQQRFFMRGLVPQGQMHENWRAADVCIMVSDAEGGPLCVAEAMAAGAVPVATRVGRVASLVCDGVTGYTVAPGDMDGMVKHLCALHRDREQLARMGRAAHEKMKSESGWDDYLEWFQTMALEVAREAPRAWPSDRKLLPASLRMQKPRAGGSSLLGRGARRVIRALRSGG